jgi:hypothetical protein
MKAEEMTDEQIVGILQEAEKGEKESPTSAGKKGSVPTPSMSGSANLVRSRPVMSNDSENWNGKTPGSSGYCLSRSRHRYS